LFGAIEGDARRSDQQARRPVGQMSERGGLGSEASRLGKTPGPCRRGPKWLNLVEH